MNPVNFAGEDGEDLGAEVEVEVASTPLPFGEEVKKRSKNLSDAHLRPIKISSVKVLEDHLAGRGNAIVLVGRQSCPFCQKYFPEFEELAREVHRKIARSEVGEILEEDLPLLLLFKGEEAARQITEETGYVIRTVPALFFKRDDGAIYQYMAGSPEMTLEQFLFTYPCASVSAAGESERGEGLVIRDLDGTSYLTTMDGQGRLRNPFLDLEKSRDRRDVLAAYARFVGNPKLMPRHVKPSAMVTKNLDAPWIMLLSAEQDLVPALLIPPAEDLLLTSELNNAFLGELLKDPGKFAQNFLVIDPLEHNLQVMHPAILPTDETEQITSPHLFKDAVRIYQGI